MTGSDRAGSTPRAGAARRLGTTPGDEVVWDDVMAFRAVAEQLNFTAAARQMHVSGPTLSHRVARLEAALGLVLLVRTTRSVRLTEPGAVLLDWAVEAGDSWRDLRASLQREAGPAEPARAPALRGVLRFGHARMDTTDLFGELRRAVPGVVWHTRGMPTGTAGLVALVEGSLDVLLWADWLSWGLHQAPGRVLEQVESALVVNEPLWVYLPVGHAAAGQDTVDVGQLAEDDWIASPQEVPMRMVRHTARRYGRFEPRIRHVTDDPRMAMSLLTEGLAVDVGPPPCAPLPPQVVARPLRRAPRTRIQLSRWRFGPVPAQTFRAVHHRIGHWYVDGYREANPDYWRWLVRRSERHPGLRRALRESVDSRRVAW
ncbi:LysR family transcriptional regulator [Micromonospora sp. DT227]|uniref:LysR family transcriptional regulator n=1 Tax=Micromonospora sp. DT227 TaxID=3393433 RepID=UPI003CE8BF16